MSFKSPYRMFSSWRAPREAAMGFTSLPYVQRVLATGPIAYWIQNEGVGLVAVEQVNGPAQNGAYTGITWPGVQVDGPWGDPSPRFDGVNDYNDNWSIPFRNAFNGPAGTINGWIQMFNAGVWTDGAVRHTAIFLVDVNNFVFLPYSSAVNNQLVWGYTAGGVAENVASLAFGGRVDWIPVGITWDAVADEVIAYGDGVQVGLTQNLLGIWAGQIVQNSTVIGAVNTGPASVTNGYLRDMAVWDRALTPAEMLNVGTA